jgi:hypothetical protein
VDGGYPVDQEFDCSITHCKDTKKMPNHELLLVEVLDTKRSTPEAHILVLERSASSNIKFDGPSLPESIAKTIKEVLAAFLSHLGVTGYQPIPNDPESPSQHLFRDAASLSVQSISLIYKAFDSFRWISMDQGESAGEVGGSGGGIRAVNCR